MELTDAEIGLSQELSDADIGLGDVSFKNQPAPGLKMEIPGVGVVEMPTEGVAPQMPNLRPDARPFMPEGPSIADKLINPSGELTGWNYVKDLATTPILPGRQVSIPQDSGFAGGLGQSLQHGLPQVTSPLGVAIAPLMTEEVAGNAIASIVKLILAGQGAQMVGQAAGNLSGIQNPTGADIGQAVGDIGQGALMTLPAVGKVYGAAKTSFQRPVQEVVPPQPKALLPEPPTEAEVLGTKVVDNRGLQLEQSKRTFQGGTPSVPLADITQMTPRELIEFQRQAQANEQLRRDQLAALPREAHAEPVIVGQQPQQAPSDIQIPFQRPIVKASVPTQMENVSGGKVSFAGEAGGLPNARQSALPQPAEQAPVPQTRQQIADELGYKYREWPKDVPMLGGQGSMTHPTEGFTVEGLKEGVTKQEVQQRMEQKLAEQKAAQQKVESAPAVESKQGGLGVKAAMEKGRARRGETGALNPTGAEGRVDPKSSPLQSVRVLLDKAKIGFADKVKVEGGQLWNRLKNTLGANSGEVKVLEETTGVKEFLKEKRSPEEVAKYVAEHGPKVEVVSYGMEGKVSEAKKEYDKMTHEEEGKTHTPGFKEYIGALGRTTDMGDLKTLSDIINSDYSKYHPTENKILNKLVSLKRKILNEPRDTSPRATQYYSTVSALPTDQPMPEWTTTKSGKNVQRVDVVVPPKPGYQSKAEQMSGDNWKTKEQTGVLWQPDNLHENLPNTLGWAMIQYKTGPKGEKIAVIAEAQSRWGQTQREKVKEIERRKSAGNDQDTQDYIINPAIESAKATDHPLLKDYNRLILKAAIEQAKKEGATHIMVSDAETAMMTEGHDAHNNVSSRVEARTQEEAIQKARSEHPEAVAISNVYQDYAGKWQVEMLAAPTQEGGMRLNYDKVLPGIMEDLTGHKGEMVTLGEHKNAFDTIYGEGTDEHTGGRNRIKTDEPRSNLIFRNPDGTPKTSVTGRIYPLDKENDFTIMGADKVKKAVTIEAPSQKGIGGGMKKAVDKNKEGGSMSLAPIKEVGKLVADATRFYSEPIVERLGRLGGPVSKVVTREAHEIVSKAKGYYGELTPVLDAAKRAASKAMRGGTTWARQVVKVTDKAATNNLFRANEGQAQVPSNAVEMMKKVSDANLAIGRLAQRATPGFVATGKLQRMTTAYGIDVVKRGSGPAWEAWTQGVAKANGVPVTDIQRFFGQWKTEMDKPGADVATLNKINQDFVRDYPNTITHIRVGPMWQEVIVADPFNYLETAAQRTAHAVAFREVYKPGSSLLQNTRTAVMKELPTHRFGNEFDNLMRALQGMPTDSYTAWWNAPDSVLGSAGRFLTQTGIAPIKALVLTGNVVTNLAESVIGGPAIFLGYRNVLPAIAKLSTTNLKDQLEMTGARNRAMYNWAMDPTSPIRSVARIGSNAVRTLSMQQLMNELQEATAAASAKVVADRIRGGQLGPKTEEYFISVARSMGFSQADATAMVRGADTKLLSQFERKAAAWLTGGNTAMGERSRAGTSRLFNELFWFHSYPMMTMNQLRSSLGTLAESIEAKDWKQTKASANVVANLIGGKVLQGALATGILALATAAMYGLKEKQQEAKSNLAEFGMDSFFMGMGGPLAIMKRALERGGDSQQVGSAIAATITPLGIAGEISDAATGYGKYEGKHWQDKVSTLVSSKTPGWKYVKTGMAILGLSKDDLELKAALRGFYDWRAKTMGTVRATRTGPVAEEGAEVRNIMRKTVEAIQQGRDWQKELAGAGDREHAMRSLLAKQVLKGPTGKELDEAQLEALRRRIGSKAVDRLQAYDHQLEVIAYGLIDREPKEKTDPREPKDLGLPPL